MLIIKRPLLHLLEVHHPQSTLSFILDHLFLYFLLIFLCLLLPHIINMYFLSYRTLELIFVNDVFIDSILSLPWRGAIFTMIL